MGRLRSHASSPLKDSGVTEACWKTFQQHLPSRSTYSSACFVPLSTAHRYVVPRSDASEMPRIPSGENRQLHIRLDRFATNRWNIVSRRSDPAFAPAEESILQWWEEFIGRLLLFQGIFDMQLAQVRPSGNLVQGRALPDRFTN